MKKILTSIIICSYPFIGNAAAGMVDVYSNYIHWLMLAYEYCLIFGLINILILTIVRLIWKDKFEHIIDTLRKYLKNHLLVAILFLGLCFSVLLGIATGVMELRLWILNIIPLFVCLLLIPLWVFNRNPRNWFLRKKIFSWLLILTIAAIMSSLAFILLTMMNLLPGTDEIYLSMRGIRSSRAFYTHPWWSMMHIWSYVFVYFGEVLLCLIFQQVIMGMRKLSLNIKYHHRNQIQ